MIVATQDDFRFEHCKGALRQSYDVLLEKPIAACAEQVLEFRPLLPHWHSVAGLQNPGRNIVELVGNLA